MSERCSNQRCHRKATAIYVGSKSVGGELVDVKYRRCNSHPLPGAHEIRPISKEMIATPESFKEALLDAERELAEMGSRRRKLRAAIEGLKRLAATEKGQADE